MPSKCSPLKTSLSLKLYYFKGGIQLTVTSVDFKTNIERKLWFAAYVSINLNNL